MAEKPGKKELFGEKAVKLGYVTERDIKVALETQRILLERSKRFGDVLLDLEFISHDQYVHVIAAMNEATKSKDISLKEASKLFCEKALEFGYITQKDIDIAKEMGDTLEEKRKLIGQVLLELGSLTNEQIQQIIDASQKE